MNKAVLAITALLALSMDACPQPWRDKDPAQWNAEECDRVLRFSPWVHYKAVPPATRYNLYAQDAPAETYVGPGWSSAVQLSSALPVRLAVQRQAQLQKLQNFMADASFWSPQADYSDTVMVTYGDSFGGIFLFLLPKGGTFRSALILADGRVILPQSEGVAMPMGIPVLAIFPRYVDGKPIHELSGSHIVFAKGEFSASTTKIVRTHKFKISDLVFRGKIEY